jgi:hypothetical protein
MGVPAERAAGTPPNYGNIIEIVGQFLSIDEGNWAERVVIGLGAGRMNVKALVQVLPPAVQIPRLRILQALPLEPLPLLQVRPVLRLLLFKRRM